MRDNGSGKGRPDGSSSKSDDPSESLSYSRLDDVPICESCVHTWSRFMVCPGTAWAMYMKTLRETWGL